MNDSAGSDTNTSQSGTLMPSRRPRGANYVFAGGLLTIGAGLLALANGTRAMLGDMYGLGIWLEIPLDKYTICSIMVIVFGIVAIMGGVAALRTRNMILASAGAALGMAGGGVLGFYLGLAALVCFFLSNENL